MTLHLEDRRRLRALAQPAEPKRDLWPGIAARIASESRARRRIPWLALAASLAGIAVLSCAIGFGMFRADTSSRIARTSSHVHAIAATDNHARWKPSDPRLRGAAIELRAAQGELQQALAIAPHSEYLQHLLQQTEQQKTRLRHLDLGAG